MQGTRPVVKQRLIVQNNAKKNHELDEAENIQLLPEIGLPHPVQLPTPWVNAVWRLPDITQLKQKATCLKNLECVLGTSQHITVTKGSQERHTPCCQITSHSPKQDQNIHDVDEVGNTQISHEVDQTLLWVEWSCHKEEHPPCISTLEEAAL